MKPTPPPDNPSEEFALRAEGVFIKIMGKTEVGTVEVAAHVGAQWYRFDYGKTTRIVRKFWKLAGVKTPQRMEGAVQHKQGLGPFLLEGIVVGTDEPREGEDGPPALVLRDVILTGKV